MLRTALLMVLVIDGAASAQFPIEPAFPECRCPLVVPFPPYETPIRPLTAHSSPQPAADVVIQWNSLALRAIKAEGTSPPVAARNLAILHIAMYDAVNAVNATHQSFYVHRTADPGTSADAAAAVAAHCTLLSLYRKYTPSFDEALDEALESIPEGPGKLAGINLGHSVAEKVLAWRSRDFDATSSYRTRTELGRWQPTLPKYQEGLLPQWASLQPFALKRVADLRPDGPPHLRSEEFVSSFREVKAIGSKNSQTRTREQTEIAYFWADGEGTVTPPGHWNLIAQRVAIDRKNTLSENALLFAMLNVAMADTAIACWDCKYHFDFWRPITAIRNAHRLNNPELEADAEWTPLLPTPPFPAYTSGHSSFSAAAAAVLACFFGTDEVRFSTKSEGLPGVTRTFSRFSAAAEEAGMSRIYGGIHWSFDNRDGLAGGRKIGEYVCRSFFQPKVTSAKRAVEAIRYR